MMRANVFLSALFLGAAAFSVQAIADSPDQADASKLVNYVNSNGLACMSCHSVSAKVVGPAWFDVAQKYHTDAKALTTLANRIQNGGSGIWGPMAMPAGMATPDQAKQLASLILGLDGK